MQIEGWWPVQLEWERERKNAHSHIRIWPPERTCNSCVRERVFFSTPMVYIHICSCSIKKICIMLLFYVYTQHGAIWCKNGRRQPITLNIMLNYIFEEEVQWQGRGKRNWISDDRFAEINNCIELCKPYTTIYPILVLIKLSYRSLNPLMNSFSLYWHRISNYYSTIQRPNICLSLFAFYQYWTSFCYWFIHLNVFFSNFFL